MMAIFPENNQSMWKALLPPVLLVFSVFVFFGHVILSGKTLFGSDFILAFHPWKQYLYDYIRSHGEVPLWNPHVLSGTPFLADMQASLFYPMGFLFYLLPSHVAYGYTVMLHWALCVVFMYAFTRSLAIGKAGAALASIVFAYNGYTVGHLYAGHLTFVQNYIWIPLIFLFLHKFHQTKKTRFALWSGLVLGIQILGGFPQIAFYTIMAAILFLGYLFFTQKADTGRFTARQSFTGACAFLLLGFSFAAVQLLPTYEFTGLSARSGGVSYEFATMDSFPPLHFLTFLMPNLFGNPANATYWKSPQVWQFWELCGYVGIGPLMLVLFSGLKKQSSGLRWFFLLLWVLSLFLAMGKYNPAYRFVYLLPGFHHFRIPAQILYLHVFSVAVLAGIGLDHLLHHRRQSPWAMVLAGGILGLVLLAALGYHAAPDRLFQITLSIAKPDITMADLGAKMNHTILPSLVTAAGLIALCCALLILFMKQRLGGATFTALFLTAVLGDLWSFALPLVKTTDLESAFRQPEAVRRVLQHAGLFRIVTLGQHLTPNRATLYGVQDIHGYNPMVLKRYLQYINKSQNLDVAPEAVNVRYVSRWDNDLLRLLNLRYALFDDGTVQEQPDSSPRAFVVYKASFAAPEKTLDFLAGGGPDPRETVLLEPPGDQTVIPPDTIIPLGEATEGDRADAFPRACDIEHYGANEIILTARLEKPGYVVLSEINYPGWQAYLDNKPLKILTGNFLFRTIPLPKGIHRIKVAFEPRCVRTGAFITAAACLFFFIFQIGALIRDRR